MVGFLKGLVLLPVAIVVVLLAVANRHAVLFSLDPFTRGQPEISFMLPLYAVIFGAIAIGILVGGSGAWLAQGKHRRARRENSREVRSLRAETERLRAKVATAKAASQPGMAAKPGLPALPGSPVLPGSPALTGSRPAA